MHALDVQLVALDLDGTLLDPGAHIQADTLDALEAYVARGGLVVIDTGRPLSAIFEIMQANSVLPHRSFPHALIAEEREIYLREDSGEFAPLQPWNDDIIAAEKAIISTAREIADRVVTELAKREIVPRPINAELEDVRGFVERHFHTRDEAEVARRIAVENIPEDVPLQVVRNSHLIALRHRDVGKGKLLARVAELLGVPRERVLAVGDSLNDLEMLDGKFGFKAATVENADAQVKEVVLAAGGTVASRPRSLGVAELIRALL